MTGDRLGESFGPVLAAAQANGGWAFERLWNAYIGPVTGYRGRARGRGRGPRLGPR